MAEIKDNKIIFTAEEQPYVDAIVAERIARDLKKTESLKLQLDAALKDKATIVQEKDTVQAELDKALKAQAETEAKFKNAGIEFDNLKTFTKDYQAQQDLLKKYQEAELLATRKTAFISAGGDEAKFDKAVKLVDFKDNTDPKDVFGELLKDDSWAILRAQATGDPLNGDKDKKGTPTSGDPERTASKGWASVIFKK